MKDTLLDLFQALTENKQKKVIDYIRRIDASPTLSENLFEEIEDLVADVVQIDISSFYLRTRRREVCVRRQVLWYIMYMHYKIPCAQIGRRYGFDHTSILHASKLVQDLIAVDDSIKEWVDQIVGRMRKAA